jgi:hypothetical protein
MNPFAPSVSNVFTPISGQAIVQTSNNRDSYGPKNAVREMVWEAIPTSAFASEWTMTLLELKSIEGLENVLTATGSFGYTAAQNIVVVSVDLNWIARGGGKDWYEVTLRYFHR